MCDVGVNTFQASHERLPSISIFGDEMSGAVVKQRQQQVVDIVRWHLNIALQTWKTLQQQNCNQRAYAELEVAWIRASPWMLNYACWYFCSQPSTVTTRRNFLYHGGVCLPRGGASKQVNLCTANRPCCAAVHVQCTIVLCCAVHCKFCMGLSLKSNAKEVMYILDLDYGFEGSW